MAAKIPQDVTREDRLIGPLTLKQFLYVLAGGALVFITFQYYSHGYLYFGEFLAIAVVIVALTLAFTFGNINGRPFGVFIINFYRFIKSPKSRVWDKADVAPLNITGIPKVVPTEPNQEPEKSTSAGQLEMLAHVLDTGGKMDENISEENRIGNIGTDIKPVDAPEVEDILQDLDK